MAGDRSRSDPIAGLTARQQGAVLGSVLAGSSGPAALQCLASPWREQCSEARERLMALDVSARRARIKPLSERLLSPLPVGLDNVHVSWLEATLQRQDPRVAAAVLPLLPANARSTLSHFAASSPVPAPTRLRLAGLVLAGLQPMDVAAAGTIAGGELIAWDTDRLRCAFVRLGCLAMADLSRRAPPEDQAQLEEALVEPFVGWLRQANAAQLPALEKAPSRLIARVWRDAATDGVHSSKTATIDDDGPSAHPTERLLLTLGTIVAAVALPRSVARAVAQRLPHDESLALRNAGEPGSNAPLLALLHTADAWARGASL